METLFKKLGYTFRRFRKCLKARQDTSLHNEGKMNLQRLQEFCAAADLDLYYADESTFSMNPCLPYGWQAKGETVGIVPQGNRKINVFGIFSLDNFCFTKFSDQNINADFIVSAIESFAQNLTRNKPSVLVLDNATTHHSLLFREKAALWQEKGLFVFYLPKYSPHLNLAELFWRKAKYEWLKPADYFSFEKFKEKISEIFTNIGIKYRINFKGQKCQPISA
ncbi:MAG: IS630 family transposase [Acidobacteria bacterium]|nr:IS630 family transposase [Acidobacteriota bacterium]